MGGFAATRFEVSMRKGKEKDASSTDKMGLAF